VFTSLSATTSRRTVRFLDALLIVWTLAWLAIGIWVAIDVHHLGRLSDTLGSAAGALHQTFQGLGVLAHIPLVGGNLGSLVNKINATATSASANAATSKTSVDQLAYLLGVVIVVIPAVPALAVYLPFRIGRMRESRAVRRSWRAQTAMTACSATWPTER